MNAVVRPTALRTSHLSMPRSRLALLAAHAAGLVALLGVIFAIPVNGPAVRLGTVASETVVALHKTPYIDRVATAIKKKQVMEGVPPVTVNTTVLAKQRETQADEFLTRAQVILGLNLSPTAKLDQLRQILPTDVEGTSLHEIATLSPADFKVVKERSIQLLSQAVDWRFDSTQVPSTEIGLLSTIAPHVTAQQRTAIGEILATFLVPTTYIDNAATLKKQRQAAARVPWVLGTIYPGEVIVRRGDLVTRPIMDKLAALGLQQPQASGQQIAASIVFSIAVVAMLFWYLHAFHTELTGNQRLLLFIDASVVLTVALARFIPPNHVLLPYFLPVAAGPTFAAVLLGPEAAVALGLAIAILVGWLTANSFELTAYYFLTSAAGVLGVRHVKRLNQFILAGGFIMLFGELTLLAFGLVDRTFDLGALQDFTVAVVANGFVSSALALGGFALLASFFGVTTNLHLLELAGPNQELVRRLMTKAPGTYNHSLIVGSMVEHAAAEIGANSLIAKVGAIYHDIGKLANPHCFVENQLGIGNVHDELRPEESARIIRGHVIQGLRLARQARLPRVVLDAIGEHHGTMSIAYFLHRAREYSDEPVDISLYTYPGPKPRSKETALIMLADGCESAVRSSNDRSHERIREIVDRIFTERIEMGQLSESPLTLHDLEVARRAFLSVLMGLYHPRIEYPEPVDTPIEFRERGIAR